VRHLAETTLLQEEALRDPRSYIAVLRAIAAGHTRANDIRQAAGLPDSAALQERLDRLMDLRLVRRERNLGAGKTVAFRYRLADPALRFYYRFVTPYESMLVREQPNLVWKERIAPDLPAYMGLIFGEVAREAYLRWQADRDLPAVREWGRWEGFDRDRSPLAIDVAATLVRGGTGSTLTGGVKWSSSPAPVKWYTHHESMLARLAASGIGWATDAQQRNAPVFFLSAAGYTDAFRAAAEEARADVRLWSLGDLFP
jgi:hypothetical protein